MATLLSWAGFNVTERDIIASRESTINSSPNISKEGFSITELARAVEALGLGVYLEQKYLTSEELKQNVTREPLIIRLIESADRPGYGRGHFTIVDGYSVKRGFRRADSLDGTYTFHGEDSLVEAALQRSQKWGDEFIAVLRLRKGGAPVLATDLITPREEETLLSTPKSRLLESIIPLSTGAAQIVFTVGRGRTRFTVPELFGLPLEESGWSASVQWRYGISDRTEIFGEVSGSRSRLALRLPDRSPVAIGDAETDFGPLAIGASTDLPVSLPPGWRLVGSFAGLVDLPARVRAVGGELDALWQISDDWRLQAGGSVSVAREASRSYTTAGGSLGVARQLSPRLLVYGEAAITFPVDYEDSAAGTMKIALNRSFGSRWAIQGFVERSLFGTRGFNSTVFGVSVGYQLPKRLRQ